MGGARLCPDDKAFTICLSLNHRPHGADEAASDVDLDAEGDPEHRTYRERCQWQRQDFDPARFIYYC